MLLVEFVFMIRLRNLFVLTLALLKMYEHQLDIEKSDVLTPF
jgi:hypothetical protein